MIFLAAIVVVSAATFGIFWIASRRRDKALAGLPPAAQALSLPSAERWRHADKMARLLDRAAYDPILATTEDWRLAATKAHDEWFGIEGKELR